MEDKFKLNDMYWISQLRFLDPKQLSNLKKTGEKEKIIPEILPSFFDKDQKKWKFKFEHTLKERKENKKSL